MKQSDYFCKMGEYFGYPECCIDNFIKVNDGRFSNKNLHPMAAEISSKTGFIPCDKHADQLLNDEIKLEDLFDNRIHSLPFPNVNRVEVMEYREKLLG